MPSNPAVASRHEVEAKLKELRDAPIGTAGSQDKDILIFHARLMSVRPGPDGVLHWFCPRAEPLTQELATFLLRLQAYSNEKVDEWRARMKGVWRGCADCIKWMDVAKTTSRTTYFGAFTDNVLSRFWVAFENSEIQAIVEALTEANITPSSSKSLADVSSPVLYHILSKPAAFRNPLIVGIVSSQPLLPRAVDWSMDPPPPGYFLLVVHEDKEVRDWAREHIANAKPILHGQFDRNHELALQILLKRLIGHISLNGTEGRQSLTPLEKEIDAGFPFSNNQRDIWTGFASILRLISDVTFESLGLHRIIIGHLHDNGSHFPEVLRCMLHATKKLSSKLWAGESADYPQVVFDSIKDNPSYTDLVLSHDAQKEQPWFLLFFLEYLRSIWDMQIFEDVLAKLAAFTCDELQHERFQNKRPIVMRAAMQILSSALTRANKLKSLSHHQAIINVIDIHLDLIVAISFSSDYDGTEWTSTRSSALSLIRNILNSDIEALANAVVELSAIEATVSSEDVKKLAPSVCRRVWWKVYTNITSKDTEGIKMLLELAARTAKLDKLSKRAVSRTIWNFYNAKTTNPPNDLLEAVDSAVDAVNASLTCIRDGFLDVVSKFASYNTSSALMSAIRQNDLAKQLIILMLSPVEDLHVAAQTLIGQAFDVDVRADCLREILRAMPATVLDGLYQYLSEFNSYASKVTEACSVSKALVRCMTDVIEVLGNSPDGLLKDPAYVKNNTNDNFSFKTELPKLWKVMTTSIAVIFKRTPRWSAYFDNNTMVEWMRDALIFARDLLERRGAFEAATVTIEDDDNNLSPESSSIGKRMVEDLQGILFELQAWLRLTDTELLYQSFALLKSLFQCFRTLEVKPSPEALAKLSKFIGQNKTSKDSRRVSFLNQADLAELELAVANFNEEDDDEVEILSVSHRKGKRKIIDRSSSPEVVEVDDPVRRKRQKSQKDDYTSKGVSKRFKQTKLSMSNVSSSSSSIQKPPRKPGKTVVRPVASKSGRRGPKFEGSLGPRPAASESSVPASASSSESNSESESSDEDKGLGVLMNRTRKPPQQVKKEVRQPVERRSIKIIEDPKAKQARLEAIERQRQQEEARKAAMRLKPDISSLHLTILSWNYDHDGADPPMEMSELSRVPDSFKSHQDYLRIFKPLLLLEAWSQILKSKEETSPEIFQIKIESRSLQHPWLDLEVALVQVPRSDWRLNLETDIVLLRHKTQKVSIMAKVTSFRKGNEGVGFGLRCCTRSLSADPGLGIGSMWNLIVVFSLSTLHREYAALMALPLYDMFDVILRPRLSDPLIPSANELERTMKAYRVNEPQAKAIVSAIGTKGFSLIQGPPGTGKTWTICGLVGAFLSSRPTPISIPGRVAKTHPVEKLLICAPSNAAVDEVTRRLIEGVRGSSGQRLLPKVVRVGAESQINVSAKEFSLDSLVDAKMNSDGSGVFGNSTEEANGLRVQIGEVKEARQKKIEELQDTVNNASRAQLLEDEIRSLNAKRIALSQQLDRLKDRMKSQNRSADATRRRYRYEILAEADVICSTLSGAGHEQLEPLDFSMVIIDEAAQSIELSSLIPLKYRCTRCIMVGDPQQLPPTVLSPEASKWGYDQSLFVRLMKHQPDAVHLLSIQYRMHPEISLLPSKVFYGGRLQDGPDMAKKTAQPWHSDPRFGSYKFYSVEHGKEESGRIGYSLFNRDECRMIAAAYDRLRKQFPSVQELRNAFRQRFGADVLSKVDFNTVDGFQGQEKDIIILSCVRAGPSLSTVGFLSDMRRMNVAITRSRCSLYIFGHAPTLQRNNKTWKGIIDDARSRSCFVELRDTSYFASSSTSQIQANNTGRRANAPLVHNLPAKPEIPPQTSSEPIVFSPKNAKGSAHRKVPRGVKVIETQHATNGIAASESQNGMPSSTQKRKHDGEQDSRLRPNDKGAQAREAGPSLSGGPTRPTPLQGHAPPKINETSAGPGSASAQRELEAFLKRKKQANSPFIKR